MLNLNANMEEIEEYPLETPQEHALMCEKHNSYIDVTCENCEEFLCANCVKENHMDHEWSTIVTAANLKSKQFSQVIKNIENEDIKKLDMKINKANEQIEDNAINCEIAVSKLKAYYDDRVKKLYGLRQKHENLFLNSLQRKNAEVNIIKSKLEEKKKNILSRVQSIKENSSTMTDIALLKSHRELQKLMSLEEDEMQKVYSLTFDCPSKNDLEMKLRDLALEECSEFPDVTITERGSFQWGQKPIIVLEAIDEDTCLLRNTELGYLEQVDNTGEKENHFSIGVNDACLTSCRKAYATDRENKTIVSLHVWSGLIHSEFSTDPLIPVGVCMAVDKNLLVTLLDNEDESFQLDLESRRLVRHLTLTGEIIKEYEFKDDSRTRLFTGPFRVTQNRKTDICVINRTSKFTGEVVNLSFAGFLNFVYRGHDPSENFNPTDVVCDCFSNIIVCNILSSKIHILSSVGNFMRYLLTNYEIIHPVSISLKNSNIWIGNKQGLVKIYKYTSNDHEVEASVVKCTQ